MLVAAPRQVSPLPSTSTPRRVSSFISRVMIVRPCGGSALPKRSSSSRWRRGRKAGSSASGTKSCRPLSST